MDDSPMGIEKNPRRKALHWWILAIIALAILAWLIFGAPRAH
jgi:hypothetical protein